MKKRQRKKNLKKQIRAFWYDAMAREIIIHLDWGLNDGEQIMNEPHGITVIKPDWSLAKHEIEKPLKGE